MSEQHNAMNPIDPDDLRLTAYALGELEGDEAGALAAQIEADAELSAQVEAIRAGAAQVDAALAEEHMIDPSPEDAAAPATAGRIAPQRRPVWFSRTTLLAAGLALAATAAITTVTLMSGPDKPESTQHDTLAVTGFANIQDAMGTTKVAIDFDNATLGEVFAFLNKQTGVAIDADWKTLEKRGISATTRVSFSDKDLHPASTVLAYALQLAWQQSPHPDPAQWSIDDAGVTIAPKSALVQARLDATQKLLDGRRFSQTSIDPKLLDAGTADVWNTDLWNQMLVKRTEAAERVIAEADASLTLAENAAKAEDYDAASEHGLYAYQLLASHGTVLRGDQFAEPMQRIQAINQAITTHRLIQQAESALAKAPEQADSEPDENRISELMQQARIKTSEEKAQLADQALRKGQLYRAVSLLEDAVLLDPSNETYTAQLSEAQKQLNAQVKPIDLVDKNRHDYKVARQRAILAYESAMQTSGEALDNKDFQAASDAVIEARTVLSSNRGMFETAEYNELTVRAARLQSEAQDARRRSEALAIEQAERERRVVERSAAQQAERQKADEVRARLTAARELQLQQKYAEAADELDAALFLDPDNPVVTGYREMINDSAISVESARLLRHRELQSANLALMDLEASTPYTDILTYPGEWPELTAVRLRQNYEFGVNFEQMPSTLGDLPVAGTAFLSTDSSRQFGTNSGLGLQSPNDFFTHHNFRGMAPNGNQTAWFTDGQVASQQGQQAGGLVQLKGFVTAEPGLRPRFGRGTVTESSETQSLQFDQDRPLAFNGSFNLPHQEHSRKSRYEQHIDHYYESLGEEEPKEDDLKQIERLKQTRDRVAATEPLERDRIAAMKELRELEREFMEGSLPALRPDPELSRDAYATVNDNPFKNPGEQDEDGYRAQAISTFSVDVDTAAYSLVRRQLMQQRQLPVPAAIRIEEMINYFDYGYDAPVVDGRALKDGVVTQASLEQFEKDNAGFAPFATHVQVTDCPWQAGNKLVRIGIQGMDVTQEERPAAHLTFLLDVSGSMNNANKLPLVKDSIKLLLDKLNDKDRISIVVYAGRTRTVMENVSATDRPAIEKALDELSSGGSTAGAAGIQLAYDAAQKHFIDGGVNRVILCTDGDFNVGISDTDDLVALIKDKANPKADADGKRRGVYLSVMGYGMGNLNDAMMEPLTNAGNGTYAYIDTIDEAQKVMYDQAGSMLVAIAKDVKVQVHFDPTQVMAYRLIGYENRILATEDFDDDTVDAGDIGAGHSVTALYEVVPFDGDGPFIDGEGIREVKLQIEQLEDAIALNTSLMQTCSLNQGQAMKLSASNKLLAQELELCRAAVQLHDTDADAGKNAEGEEQQKVGEAPAVAEADKDARPRVELDQFEDGAMMSLRLRYKPVDAPAEEGSSRRIDERIFADDAVPFNEADEATRFAASVAGFGMVLRSSPHKGDADLGWVLDTATASLAHDPDQRRAEFIELVGEALTLMPEENAEPEDPGAPK